MTVEKAKSIICRESHPNTPKELVKEKVLLPLEETGLIATRYGTVAVHPLTDREEYEAGGQTDE